MIIPEKCFDINDTSKRYVWEFLAKDYWAEKIFSFHNISINERHFDVILLATGYGAAVISIRNYNAEEIIEITSQRMIKLSARPVEYAPIIEAIKNREILVNEIKAIEAVDERFITSICCYPYIDETEFNETYLNRLSPRELTLLKNDFENVEVFENKITDIFHYVFEAQKLERNKGLSIESIEKIGEKIVPGFRETKSRQPEKTIEEKIDLYANSDRELNYGICSFLMKNGILSGKIYSESKRILDCLGEYMDSVRIPWSYDFAEVREVGYCFVDGGCSNKDKDSDIVIFFDGKKEITVSTGTRKKYNIEIHNRNEVYEKLDEIEIGKPIHLKNEQIRQMFLKGFKIAENEIDIVSPWMNFGVVNEDFVELMREALERGVVIKIIYGLKPSSSEYNISRSKRSDQVAEYLKNEFKEYQKQLFINRDNIHYKLVLCDEKFKLEGGYNYLSFVGDYESPDTRKEGSPFGTSVEEIRYLRREYFEEVR